MAITLKDVASVAGVSTATVSRALAGSDKVAPRTANHVREIADNLGYRFDNVARALRQKRSNLIGLVVPDLGSRYVQELLVALNRELYASEFVLAATSSFGDVDHEFVQIERLLGQRIDALLIVPVDIDKSARAIEIAISEDTPVIQLNRQVKGPPTTTIHFDYAAGIGFALRFFKLRNMKSFLFVDNNSILPRIPCTDPRLDALKQHAIERSSLQATMAMIAKRAGPDVIFCRDYRSAIEITQAFDQVAGIKSRPLLACLDKIAARDICLPSKVISVEFSMYSLAEILVDHIARRLNKEVQYSIDLHPQPFLNLSRL